MASIFTFEPDPPRVSSPWLEGESLGLSGSPNETDTIGTSSSSTKGASVKKPRKVTRLQAEPQEGPVEYKLHLLLRPRRKFRSISTGSHISGSRHSQIGGCGPQQTAQNSDVLLDVESSASIQSPSASALTQQTRQHRLEQLTTQLLWRLQQSSSHHSSSATNTILPQLPEALPELQAPPQPAKLLHGLEESQGALYEIGVSDDGTLVGLAEDEMQESLNNLRAMAGCLGCTVEVLRKEFVGECEWMEEPHLGRKQRPTRRTGKLVVAEALIKPYLAAQSPQFIGHDLAADSKKLQAATSYGNDILPPPATDQLRVTLTGPTMSGKSTLLGTLTTSTLDNGRGKSRLSMLKHRHEITTGITSSVTQELLGYQDTADGNVSVINYAADNVASWIDVHFAAAGSRLVFVCDSAGHPRYRRTTVRGLVGWAPHWTLLCIPADDTEEVPHGGTLTGHSPHGAGIAVSEMDLSGAQLSLCLRLRLPLVVVITKLDLASRSGLKQTLTKVLDALKAAGRKPAILPNPPGSVLDEESQTIKASIIDAACNAAIPLLNDPTSVVPIVLTSAVEGTGVPNLHALLHELPLPDISASSQSSSSFVFHIEDVYTKPTDDPSVIISGHLRSGQISVGSCGTIGPFSTHDHSEDSEDSDERPRRTSFSSHHPPASRSFPGAFPHLSTAIFALPNQEWKRIRVTSVRNLRLPVHTLMPGQVGTLAITPDKVPAPEASARTQTTNSTTTTTTTKTSSSNRTSAVAATKERLANLARIRKGMVLAAVQPLAARAFVAEFQREDVASMAVGNHIVAYTASVRASARIISARVPDSPVVQRPRGAQHDGRNRDGAERREDDDYDDEDDAFNFGALGDALLEGDSREPGAGAVTAPTLLVTFRFDSAKEFVVVGDAVLVMPGGGPALYGGHERGEKGLAGLEGFVGRVTEVSG